MARSGRKRIEKSIRDLLSVKQDKVRYFPALLGAYVNGQKTLQVSGRPDFVWCRLRGGTSEVIQAFNDKVALHWDLPVLVYRDPEAPNQWRIHGRDIRAYQDWEGASYMPPHADSHSFSGGERTGSDVVWTYKRQYMPMLPRPIASGTMAVYIEPDFYYFEGGFHWWPGSGTADLSSYRPTGAYNARYVTVYIEGNSGNPAVLAGDEFSMILPPDDPGSYIPIPTPDQGVPIAAVTLQTGTSRIGWGEIYDLRNPNRPADVTGSTISIYDESVYMGAVQGLNIVGDNVVAVVSGTIAHIYHTGSAGGGGHETGTMVIYDEGTWLGVFDEMRFIGEGVQVFNSGTYAAIAITGSAATVEPPVTGSVVVLDEGVIQGSATELDFVGDGVSVILAGDRATITIPGGGGGAGCDSTYLRAGAAIPLATPTGGYWQVPDEEFATGTLSIMLNGVWQEPIVDYQEQYPTSGTFEIYSSTPTGSIVAAIWGNLCSGSANGDIGTGSVGVYDEGVFLGQAENFNFVGDTVEAVLSGTTAHIMHTGSAGGGGHATGTMVIYDEGDWLGVFDEMRFIGAGVDVYNSGSYAAVNIPGGGGAGGMTLLSETSITGSVASVTIDSISQDYRDLLIIIEVETADASEQDFPRFRLGNGAIDSGNNYAQALNYDGTSSGQRDSSGQSYVEFGPVAVGAGDATANALGQARGIIRGYAESQWTAIEMRGMKAGDTYYICDGSAMWKNTDPIERIQVFADGGNLTSGRILVFGIGDAL